MVFKEIKGKNTAKKHMKTTSNHFGEETFGHSNCQSVLLKGARFHCY